MSVRYAACATLLVFACHRQAPPPPSAMPDAPTSSQDTASSELAGNRFEVRFPSGDLTLVGYLWLPRGPGPHRAVVYSHGSEREPGDGYALARFFNDHHFVFFLPHRRGHGKSQGRYWADVRDEAWLPGTREELVVRALEAQVDDVMAGLAFVASRSEVRKDAIAIAGCSFGGIEVVLSAERPSAFRVAVDFAGAAQTWQWYGSLRERMIRAVDQATIPILFLQAENDFDTTPSTVLSAEMDRVGKPYRRILYPPHGTTSQEGHSGFCRDPSVWGADVLAWIDSAMP